jgi:hypothetical protein
MKHSRMLSKLALGTFLLAVLVCPAPAWTAAANDLASTWADSEPSLSAGHR